MVLVPATLKLLGEYNWWCPAFIKWVVDFLGLQESEDGLESLDETQKPSDVAVAVAIESDVKTATV